MTISSSSRGPRSAPNLVNYDGFKAGPIARYRFGRDEDDNNALDGLGDVNDSIELGGFLKYEIGIWSAGLTVAQDVAGGHEGLVAEATAGVARVAVIQGVPAFAGMTVVGEYQTFIGLRRLVLRFFDATGAESEAVFIDDDVELRPAMTAGKTHSNGRALLCPAG
jgi:hypothetical protein